MKTKRTRAIRAASAALFLFLLLVVVRKTGILNYYKLPTSAMAPNYPKGSLIFSSRLFTPALNDAVVYRDSSTAVPGFRKAAFETYIGRLVAQEGDVLEIRDGHTFIGGRRSDEGLRVYCGWALSRENFGRNKGYFKDLAPDLIQPVGPEVEVFLEDAQAGQLLPKIPEMKRLDPSIRLSGYAQNWGEAGADWTLHNFGPITVPPGQVFILGDNRADSEDSRYRGFVPAKDVVAKVLN